MANDSPVHHAAEDTAQRIENAVKKGDKDGYAQITSNEIGDYGKTHSPKEAKEYMAAITKKLQDDHVLPAISIFEAQRDFSAIDDRGNGRLTKEQLDKYETNGGLNDFRKGLIENVKQDYDRIRNFNTSFETWRGGNSDAITKADIEKGVGEERALLNLFAKDEKGNSLYERITDANGDINAHTIRNLLITNGSCDGKLLTPEQAQTLHVLQDTMSLWEKFNPLAKDLTEKDLASMAKQCGTDLPTLQAAAPKGSEVDDRHASPAELRLNQAKPEVNPDLVANLPTSQPHHHHHHQRHHNNHSRRHHGGTHHP